MKKLLFAVVVVAVLSIPVSAFAVDDAKPIVRANSTQQGK